MKVQLSIPNKLSQQSSLDLHWQTVNRINRDDRHLARRAERQANQVDTCDHQLRIIAVRRDAHDTTPPTKRGRDVEIAVAIERETLRPSESLEKHVDIAVRIDPPD